MERKGEIKMLRKSITAAIIAATEIAITLDWWDGMFELVGVTIIFWWMNLLLLIGMEEKDAESI